MPGFTLKSMSWNCTSAFESRITSEPGTSFIIYMPVVGLRMRELLGVTDEIHGNENPNIR
jgi:hypothetical protein